MAGASKSQHLTGVTFPASTLMDVPKAQLVLPPRLESWLARSCTGTAFGVVILVLLGPRNPSRMQMVISRNVPYCLLS